MIPPHSRRQALIKRQASFSMAIGLHAQPLRDTVQRLVRDESGDSSEAMLSGEPEDVVPAKVYVFRFGQMSRYS